MNQNHGPSDIYGSEHNQGQASCGDDTQIESSGARKKKQKEKSQLSPADAWLKNFTKRIENPEVRKFKEHCTELINVVFQRCYKKPLAKLDPTGERASERRFLYGRSLGKPQLEIGVE
ncbi:MAG: hypothetical protein EZS28_044783 [Streblomastix strix]|uniref:Uncharacterized protein n=1 Tax=Streblomastix strix TaxID=222440 RepID=A0A5J4TP90_9EUKA|nr:MAG: hypothetical protein EZS28_044783 [Streblomastix strix]